MFRSLLAKSKFVPNVIKNNSLNIRNCSNKPVEPPPTGHADIHRKLYPPNKFERRMLVWTGRYKSLEEIPTIVPIEAIEKARNKMRIKVANYMMVATLIGCLFMAISGKRAAERGESVAKMNLDWHKEMNKKSD